MAGDVEHDSEYLNAFENEVEIGEKEDELQDWKDTQPNNVLERDLRDKRIKELTKMIKQLKLSRNKGLATGKRGRKPGDGAYRDEPFLEEMRLLIEKGAAKSPNQAADMVAHKAIGEVYAKAMAKEGAKVVVSDIADPSRVADEINADGGSAISVEADVTSDESWAALVEKTEAEFGPIEILVNNAALFAELMITPIMKMSNEEWDRVMLVNARGSFQGIKATVPSMIKNGRGKIINISSGTFYYGGPGFANYVSSKGAILGLTRSAARELGDKNIFVNCIVPGFTESEGVQNHPQLDIARAPTLQSRMLKRDMMPEDLIGALLFYASEDSDFLTGQSMNVDGGKYCQ